DLLGAVVGQRQDARAWLEETGCAGLADDRDEGIGAHVEGDREALTRGVDEAAFEVLAAGKGQRMDEDVQHLIRPVGSPPLGEYSPDLLVRLNIARFDEGRPDRLSQWPDAPFEEALDRAEANARARLMERLGDAPGDRMVIGDPEDECPPAIEHAHGCLRVDPRPV